MGYEEVRELVKENIKYDILTQNPQQDKEQLDEVVDLMAETLCSRRQTIVVVGDEYPAEMVKEKTGFLKNEYGIGGAPMPFPVHPIVMKATTVAALS